VTAATIAKPGTRAPRRVQVLLDLAAKLEMKTAETTDQTVSTTSLQMRTWAISPTRHAWDTSQIWITWMRFSDERSMGKVRATWYHLDGRTTPVKLREVWSVIQTLAGR